MLQYVVQRLIMDRKRMNPSGDPWDTFFYNIYKPSKPTIAHPTAQRKISIKRTVREVMDNSHFPRLFSENQKRPQTPMDELQETMPILERTKVSVS